MKKLRFILLSAVLAAVFGFSFIGCSNYSSNGGSSNHDMTIKLKEKSGATYIYYADYDANDLHAKGVSAYYEMKVFKSDGTEITDGSVYITHQEEQTYKLKFTDETSREVQFATKAPYKFSSAVKPGFEDRKIVGLIINGNQYSPQRQPN